MLDCKNPLRSLFRFGSVLSAAAGILDDLVVSNGLVAVLGRLPFLGDFGDFFDPGDLGDFLPFSVMKR